MIIPPFKGSSGARNRFWSDVRAAAMTIQKIAGKNVSIDEHPGVGTVVSFASRKVAKCSSASSVAVQFAGVSMTGCGCIDMTPTNPTCNFSIRWLADPGLNGLFTVPFGSSGSGFIQWVLTVPMSNKLRIYECNPGPNTTCNEGAGSAWTDGANSFNIVVYCDDGTGGFAKGLYAFVFVSFGTVECQLFCGGPVASISGATIANSLACGVMPTSPFCTGIIGAGFGGTCTVTWV